jgi:hypothetical protein
MLSSIEAILIVSIFLGGCTIHHEIKPVLERRPLVEALPLTVGIYFGPEFGSYHASRCVPLLCDEYDLGPPSVALFEIIVAGLFEKVLVVDSIPPPDSNLKVAGILEPAIANFHPHENRLHQIIYRVTLYSPAGADLGAWEVDGASVDAESFPHTPGKVTRLAMRRAAARFVKEFRKEPVVMSWLKEAGVKLSGPTESQSKEGMPP